MKFKTLSFSVILLLGICIGIEAAPSTVASGIIFDRPTEKLLAGHSMAQAHLYFDDVEVPPMYCTVDKEKITIHGQAIPKADQTGKAASGNNVRLEWRNAKGEVMYQLTKILPRDKKRFGSSKNDWTVTSISKQN